MDPHLPKIKLYACIWAYFRYNADSVPDHHKKKIVAIKQITQVFWLPDAHESYAYTIPQGSNRVGHDLATKQKQLQYTVVY